MHKQWAAGAPVIGAAPVPSGRPKRLFRLTGIRRVERSNFSIRETRLQVAFPLFMSQTRFSCSKPKVAPPQAALQCGKIIY
jgi:hypothetical protein